MKGRYPSGGVVDSKVPDRAVKLLAEHGVADTEFLEWLGNNLGAYRMFAIQHPGIKEQLRDIRKLAALMSQVRQGLELDALPPECRAICDDVSWNVYGELFFDREQRLRHDLLKSAAMLEHSAKVMASRARRGRRKTSVLRNRLLDGVVARLVEAGLIYETAREVAGKVMLHCGDHFAPTSERAVRRATATRKTKKAE